MRIAVIGNGPSAKGLGAEIDACDFVVRTGQCINAFKENEAGTKLSAWAWPGYPKMNRYVPKGKGWQMWVTCPAEWHKGEVRMPNVARIANQHKLNVQVLNLNEYTKVRVACKALSGKDLPPTTGILAIHMALMKKPAELLLAGFDCTIPTQPGFCYADGRKGLSVKLHDYTAEKVLTGHLLEGKWLGAEVATVTEWRKL